MAENLKADDSSLFVSLVLLLYELNLGRPQKKQHSRRVSIAFVLFDRDDVMFYCILAEIQLNSVTLINVFVRGSFVEGNVIRKLRRNGKVLLNKQMFLQVLRSTNV